MIRKDLNSTNVYDSGVALGGLACFVSHDLARDLANDVVTLVSVFVLCGRRRYGILVVTENRDLKIEGSNPSRDHVTSLGMLF